MYFLSEPTLLNDSHCLIKWKDSICLSKFLKQVLSSIPKCYNTKNFTLIAMAKTAFWQNKELMRSNIRAQTKLRILNCYVFWVLNYCCESWPWNKAVQKKIDAFEF